MLRKLERANGTTTSDPSEMGLMASIFYKDLITSEGTTNMQRVIDTVPSKVTHAMNTNLTAEYKLEEVKEVLFQMAPLKALGSDGYPAHFFQRHWEVCGAEIADIVLKILRGEDNPEGLNDTILVLIPKVNDPCLLSQFHPISLCNVIYKIASKVVANRLK